MLSSAERQKLIVACLRAQDNIVDRLKDFDLGLPEREKLSKEYYELERIARMIQDQEECATSKKGS